MHKQDLVNHPPHYQGGQLKVDILKFTYSQNEEGKMLDANYDLEVIEVIEAFDLDRYLANAIKYILRSGKKEGEVPEKDLRKAIWYLERKIKNDSIK